MVVINEQFAIQTYGWFLFTEDTLQVKAILYKICILQNILDLLWNSKFESDITKIATSDTHTPLK